MVVDAREFKQAMSQIPSAVHIITSVDEFGAPCGFVASAVCSLSDEPPTVLVCVNRKSRIHPVIRREGRLCVNVLTSNDVHLVPVFAGGVNNNDERFAHGEWTFEGVTLPVLRSARYSMLCKVVMTSMASTHDVFFCELLETIEGAVSGGLVYYDRKFYDPDAMVEVRHLADAAAGGKRSALVTVSDLHSEHKSERPG
jgi:flavin reductase